MRDTGAVRGLVVGASGLVGAAVLRALGSAGTGTYRSRPRAGLTRLEAADCDAFAGVIASVRPDAVFLAAAEPNVEWCEAHPEEGRLLNSGPVDAALAAAGRARIVWYSTDYVFDGSSGPYAEGDPPGPLSAYGRIKAEIERRLLDGGHTVIRTTTVFGCEEAPSKNFVLRLVGALRRGEIVRIPSDQISTPTYAEDLAAASVRIAADGAGVWHVAGPDLISRSDLAVRVARAFDLPADGIHAVPTRELAQVAVRPLRGGLTCARYEAAFGRAGRRVDDALADLRALIDN